MAITLVQQSPTSAAGTTTFSATLAGTVAGNTIVIVVFGEWATSATFSISDGVNTYSSTPLASNGTDIIQCFYCLAGIGGNITVTASAASGSLNRIWASIREYSSSGLSLDGNAGFVSSSTASPTSSSLNTTGANDLLIGGMVDFNANSGGVTGAWGNAGLNNNPNSLVCVAEDQLNKAASSYQAQFTLNVAETDWAAIIVAFKEASAVGQSTTTTPYIGLWSKDGVLYTGAFDVGIPILFGLFDDGFVAQFSGTSVGATATGVTSAPAGIFSKDATLIGAFDA